ncbi:MAG: hypothetical protein J2P59_09340, partial [Acidimicrobiales bacterium]|nr:hypothetical protein [Acidimicrobiales bacterium]
LLELLAHEDRELQQLLSEYLHGAAEDPVRRGVIVHEVRERLAAQDAAKQQLVHTLALDLGHHDLAQALDDGAVRRRKLLGELERLTSGVSPRDVQIGVGDDVVAVVAELERELAGSLAFERYQVAPLLRQTAPPGRLDELSARLHQTRRVAPTRPRASAPLEHRRRSRLWRKVKARFDRFIVHGPGTLDMPQHETGPRR